MENPQKSLRKGGLYKIAKNDYKGSCEYCGKALANEMVLKGFDICAGCDQEIMSGLREPDEIIIKEDFGID